MTLPSTWNIGLSAWIVQDGNYPDFMVGETVEFAVKFSRQPGTAVDVCVAEREAKQVAETAYDVVAAKVLATDDLTILDIGFQVYREGPSELPDLERVKKASEQKVDLLFWHAVLRRSEKTNFLSH